VDDPIGAMPPERFGIAAPVDADHASKLSAATRLNASHGVFHRTGRYQQAEGAEPASPFLLAVKRSIYV
jgi:hypothetical protein